LDAEIAKCENKLQLARLNLDKVRKVEAQPDYAETVPENVRLINEDRVRVIVKASTRAIYPYLYCSCRGKR
jgi:valyl-tRNA synthetase